MKALFLFLSVTLTLPAKAAETLAFAAKVQNDALAEEAILLLHCLADRSGRAWEFTGVARGTAWLKVDQRQDRLHGLYHSGDRESPVDMGIGESEAVCQKLEPEQVPSLVPTLAPLEPSLPLLTETKSPKIWAWVGVGAAVVIGFLWWKSRQPDHRSLRME